MVIQAQGAEGQNNTTAQKAGGGVVQFGFRRIEGPAYAIKADAPPAPMCPSHHANRDILSRVRLRRAPGGNMPRAHPADNSMPFPVHADSTHRPIPGPFRVNAQASSEKTPFTFPLKVCCTSCYALTFKGTRTRCKKEDASSGETFLGLPLVRYRVRCQGCKASIVMNSNALEHDFRLEKGAMEIKEGDRPMHGRAPGRHAFMPSPSTTRQAAVEPVQINTEGVRKKRRHKLRVAEQSATSNPSVATVRPQQGMAVRRSSSRERESPDRGPDSANARIAKRALAHLGTGAPRVAAFDAAEPAVAAAALRQPAGPSVPFQFTAPSRALPPELQAALGQQSGSRNVMGDQTWQCTQHRKQKDVMTLGQAAPNWLPLCFGGPLDCHQMVPDLLTWKPEDPRRHSAGGKVAGPACDIATAGGNVAGLARDSATAGGACQPRDNEAGRFLRPHSALQRGQNISAAMQQQGGAMRAAFRRTEEESDERGVEESDDNEEEGPGMRSPQQQAPMHMPPPPHEATLTSPLVRRKRQAAGGAGTASDTNALATRAVVRTNIGPRSALAARAVAAGAAAARTALAARAASPAGTTSAARAAAARSALAAAGTPPPTTKTAKAAAAGTTAAAADNLPSSTTVARAAASGTAFEVLVSCFCGR